MAVSEFDLIERFFAPLGTMGSGKKSRGVSLGIGDDCALLDLPPGQQLAVSIDTLVSGVHFPPDTPPAQIARRALGACVSDLAAMGAEPVWLTLALTLPESNPRWLEPFSRALAEGVQAHGLALVGGDTTRGPLTVTLQVHGWVPHGQALRRDGACPGDLIYVTGTLGDAMAGLDQVTHAAHPDPFLSQRFYAPEPRVSTGLALRGLASAAIDLSDGLLGDLGHLLERSGCGALIDLRKLPLSEPLRHHYPREQALTWAQSGGEDFELCFTLPAVNQADYDRVMAGHSVSCTRIGVVEAVSGLRATGADGVPVALTASGYRHF